MSRFEDASIDKGIYDRWDKVKTGRETLCDPKENDEDEDDVKDFDQRLAELLEKQRQERIKEQNRLREQRALARSNLVT